MTRPPFDTANLPEGIRLAKREMVLRLCRPECSLADSLAMHYRIADLQRSAGQLIHAIGIGRKRVSGKLTPALSIRIYLSRKLPKGLVAGSDLIPPLINGVPTDIIEAAPAFFSAPVDACTLKRLRRQRPLRPGISFGNLAVVGGTLGARVRSRLAAERDLNLVLSNNHVLADFGDAPIGSEICQPAAGDGGAAADVVGTLFRFEPIVADGVTVNRVDAALASIHPAIDVSSSICTIGSVKGTGQARLGMAVHKHGRTTGLSNGVIDDIDCDVLMPLSRQEPERVARFAHQLRIRPRTGASRFSQSGDSGALVVDKASGAAVGLLFACPDDGSYSYANPIRPVLDALQVDLR